jgi:nucleotide-binding universal stress UspA family protein
MEKKFKILLVTDYSESVMSAECFAVQFSKNTMSDLTMFHAYQVPLGATPPEPEDFAIVSVDIKKSELRTLEQHQVKLFKSLNVTEKDLKCECIVAEGSAGKEIRREAEELEMDFIVMGTHGASGFREFFLGSHTWDVIKKATVPVFAIPKDVLFSGIKNIVFATDYREGEVSVINFLVQFSKQFNAAVTVLHITDYAMSAKEEAELFDKFKTEVSDRISYDKVDFRHAHYYDIVAGLNDYCLRAKTDLLVLSPEKPFLLENIFSPVTSITRKMTFNTHIPLLSIPDYYKTENSKFWELFRLDEKYLDEEY